MTILDKKLLFGSISYVILFNPNLFSSPVILINKWLGKNSLVFGFFISGSIKPYSFKSYNNKNLQVPASGNSYKLSAPQASAAD